MPKPSLVLRFLPFSIIIQALLPAILSFLIIIWKLFRRYWILTALLDNYKKYREIITVIKNIFMN